MWLMLDVRLKPAKQTEEEATLKVLPVGVCKLNVSVSVCVSVSVSQI